MQSKAFYFGFALALAALFSFSRCINPPDYSDVPEITFLSLSKNTMVQSSIGTDSIIVTFSFTDGDGDLGSQNKEPNIFIVDGRDAFARPPYALPYIEPQGAGNGISGEISVRLPNVCCINDDGTSGCDDPIQSRDTLFYRIKIKDRAGHESNEIVTSSIVLVCK